MGRLVVTAVLAAIFAGCGGGGPELDVSDEEAQALLFQTAQDPNAIDTFYLVVQSGVDLNSTDASGRTALHYAVAADNGEAVRVLLLAGIDPEIKDAEGRTARDWAEQEDMMSAVQAFERFDRLATVR